MKTLIEKLEYAKTRLIEILNIPGATKQDKWKNFTKTNIKWSDLDAWAHKLFPDSTIEYGGKYPVVVIQSEGVEYRFWASSFLWMLENAKKRNCKPKPTDRSLGLQNVIYKIRADLKLYKMPVNGMLKMYLREYKKIDLTKGADKNMHPYAVLRDFENVILNIKTV